MKKQIGFRKGRLTIIEFLHCDSAHKQIVRCLCDCGKIKDMRLNNLKGKTSSCGCLKAELIRKRFKLEPKGVLLRQMMNQKVHDCRQRKLELTLTIEQLEDLCFKNCFYCDAPPSNVMKRKEDSLVYNGIDRINNNKGYIFENCVPCCFDCNKMKHTKSLEEFRIKINKIYKALNK